MGFKTPSDTYKRNYKALFNYLTILKKPQTLPLREFMENINGITMYLTTEGKNISLKY